MKATVTSKGQVTIPKGIREQFGIEAGAVLDFVEDEGRIIVRKISVNDPVQAVYGMLRDGRQTDDIVAELRGEAQ